MIPGLYGSRADWVGHHPLARHGVAYGLDDLDHARATRPLVIEDLRAREAEGLETVRSFIRLTQARFA